MKINPDDPWYPIPAVPNVHAGEPGVTIRLHLAAKFSAALVAATPGHVKYNEEFIAATVGVGTQLADAQIKRADSDERIGMTAQTHMWREQNGHPIHDADCYYRTVAICTCGLLHHLAPCDEGIRVRIYPPFNGEIHSHEGALDRAVGDAE